VVDSSFAAECLPLLSADEEHVGLALLTPLEELQVSLQACSWTLPRVLTVSSGWFQTVEPMFILLLYFFRYKRLLVYSHPLGSFMPLALDQNRYLVYQVHISVSTPE